MAVSQPDPAASIVACAKQTFRNWILAVPNFVVTLLAIVPILIFGGAGLLSMIFSGSLTSDPMRAAGVMVPSLIAGLAISATVAIVLGIISVGATYAGAGEALAGRPIDLSSLLRRGSGYFGTICLYFLIVIGVCVVVNVLVGILTALTAGLLGFILIPLLICAGLAAAYFLMYVLPAIVLGHRNATEAMRRSFELAYANVGVSLTAVVGLIVAGICAWVAAIVLHFIPLLGALAGLAISGLYGAFQALLVSKLYLDLTGGPTAQPSVHGQP